MSTWMLYGAAGYTGALYDLDQRARQAGVAVIPGIAASVRENLPYGGWTRRTGRLHPQPLGSGITTVAFPDGPCHVMPFPTGDLEAAFLATGAPDISFGWARATGPDGAVAQAVLETGESYAFTAAASIRAVEETLTRSPRGALSPATAFGSDFTASIPDTTRTDTTSAAALLA